MTYSQEQVSLAITRGMDLVLFDHELALGDREHDLLNLVANAMLTCLDSPDASLDDVIRQNYENSPAVVRSWIE